MWRLVSLKTLVCLVFLILGLTLLIISRTQTGSGAGVINKYAALGLNRRSGLSTEDDGINYYASNVHNSKLKKETADYPFEDDFGNDNKPNNNNDFDPLSGPSDDKDVAAEVVGKTKAAKIKTKGQQNPAETKHETVLMDQLTCDVNHGKYKIDCMKDQDNEVYVPFSFLHKYFEIFGKLSDTDPDTFIWLHSMVKIYRPKGVYDPKGVFTYFENYNVEVRDRVKCVSGSEGVPVSTQWDTNGYFYPIQIAQFGLSHYSKFVVDKNPTRVIIEDGDTAHSTNWILNYPEDLRIRYNPDQTSNKILEIQPSKNEETAIKLPFKNLKPHLLVLSWDMKLGKTETSNDHYLRSNPVRASPIGSAEISITVTVRYESQVYHLHYTNSEYFIRIKNNHIYHGLGQKSDYSWQHVIRDLGVDLQKGVTLATAQLKKKAQKLSRSKVVVESISVVNLNTVGTPLFMDNVTLASNEHLAQFFQAVDWFVKAQDSNGGWPIPVTRKFNAASNFYPVLKAGWYSAMGQGHGLSLLSRAYALTKDLKYAAACAKAVASIFDNSGEKNRGVRAVFLNKFTWYEEYPTIPSSFVLNGFMYALLGLYDVQALDVPGASEKSRELYQDGVTSLITMLPLYDTGSGTMYDLRHFTVPGISPNLARLDYHVTHINQLLTFATIHENPIFATVAERWIRYTEGERASHN